MDRIRPSLLAALAYSDIFDYPLTKAELWRYLITTKKIRFSQFSACLSNTKGISQKERLYFLSGRRRLVALRCKRQKISQKKLEKIMPIIRLLSTIPTVMFVGLSGSLAMQNAEKNADTDIFLITKENTLWVTRLLVLCILQAKKVRRKRGQQKASGTICINMLVDTMHLSFPKNRRNIYTAHEIAQMKVLFSRDNTYEQFLKANAWVSTLLPNSIPVTALRKIKLTKTSSKSFLQILETSVRFAQMLYMKNHQTSEVVTKGFVAFHPIDYTQEVLFAFEKRKKKYGI